MRRRAVPRLASALLRLGTPRDRVEFVLGDLEEEWHERAEADGAWSARRWYWRHVLHSVAVQWRDGRRHRAPRTQVAWFHRLGNGAAAIGADLRYAARSSRRSPGFALAAVATLGLGIGANTAIYTVVDSVVLRPLPYEESGRIVAVWPQMWFSKQLFDRFHDEATSYEALAAYSENGYTRTDGTTADLVMGPSVTTEYLAVLRAAPVLGRAFAAEENRPGRQPVVVITHGMWQRDFGSRPDVVGQTLRLEGMAWTVIGVLPEGFQELQADAEVVVPFTMDPAAPDYQAARYLRGIGRLRPGVTPAEAQREVLAIAGGWQEEFGLSDQFAAGATVVPMREQLSGGVRSTMFILLGAVGLTLLIACANVANLFLARAIGRQREVGVRMALGANRRRIIAQVLTESVFLGLAGGIVGTVLAVWGVGGLVAMMPEDLPRVSQISTDAGVLGFSLVIALGTGVLFGLVPALRGSQLDLTGALRDGGRGSTAGSGSGVWRAGLVIVQIAVAVVLVIGAGLLIESFWRIQRVDPGFAPDGLATFQTIPPAAQYQTAESVFAFHAELQERLGSLPGVRAVGAINVPPMIGGGWVMDTEVEGTAPDPDQGLPSSYWRLVTPEYMETANMRLVRGRPLSHTDRSGQPEVAIVNQTMAERYWPGEDPLGRRFRIAFDNPDWMTVVGVVANVRHLGLNVDVPPTAYRPYAQGVAALHRAGPRTMSFLVRTDGEPSVLLEAVRRATWELDPDVPLYGIRMMPDAIHQSLDAPRFTMSLLVLFAVTALLLGAIGVYGVISYGVSERSQEICIRMALGANRRDVVWSVVVRGLLVAAAGVVIGVIGALGATRVLASLMFGVETTDLSTFAIVPVAVLCVAVMASFVPAWRASRIDTMLALRGE